MFLYIYFQAAISL